MSKKKYTCQCDQCHRFYGFITTMNKQGEMYCPFCKETTHFTTIRTIEQQAVAQLDECPIKTIKTEAQMKKFWKWMMENAPAPSLWDTTASIILRTLNRTDKVNLANQYKDLAETMKDLPVSRWYKHARTQVKGIYK